MSENQASVFPDRRWGSEDTPLRELAVRFSCTKAGSNLIKLLAPLDRRMLMRSNGRFTILGPVAAPVLLLTTTGAKSGKPRTAPLLFGRGEGDTLIVVGSNFGQAHHPTWTTNLLKSPQAVAHVAGKAVPVTAELLAGEEAAQAYRMMVDIARTYAEYSSRTDREIRVFRLAATT